MSKRGQSGNGVVPEQFGVVSGSQDRRSLTVG